MLISAPTDTDSLSVFTHNSFRPSLSDGQKKIDQIILIRLREGFIPDLKQL